MQTFTIRASPSAEAVTALSPSHFSPGLTGQWRAQNRRTTDYHTAPSLVPRCRLMGSWKVKMKKRFPLHASLSLIFSLRHSAATDRCHRFHLSVCLALGSFLCATLPQVKTEHSQSSGSEGVRGEAGEAKKTTKKKTKNPDTLQLFQ